MRDGPNKSSWTGDESHDECSAISFGFEIIHSDAGEVRIYLQFLHGKRGLDFGGERLPLMCTASVVTVTSCPHVSEVSAVSEPGLQRKRGTR